MGLLFALVVAHAWLPNFATTDTFELAIAGRHKVVFPRSWSCHEVRHQHAVYAKYADNTLQLTYVHLSLPTCTKILRPTLTT